MSDVRGCEKISHVRGSFICRSIYTSFFLKNPSLRRSREKPVFFFAPPKPKVNQSQRKAEKAERKLEHLDPPPGLSTSHPPPPQSVRELREKRFVKTESLWAPNKVRNVEDLESGFILSPSVSLPK